MKEMRSYGVRYSKAVLLAVGLSFATVSTLVLAIFFVANGPRLSVLCLASIPVLVLLFLGVVFSRRYRKVWCYGLAAGLLVLDVSYAAHRMTRTPSRELRYCENGDCQRRAPWYSRIPDEGETALVGLTFSSALGLIGGRERESLERLLTSRFDRLRRSRRYQHLPNSILINSSPEQVRWLVWEPDGSDVRPCLIFLHGFGGQLSIYLQALIDSPLGEHFVIIAPFLDSTGAWWTPRGEAIVQTVIEDYLPERVNRREVFLVGLSNGAIGTAHLWSRPELSQRLAGVVMISGSDSHPRWAFSGHRGLVISGTRDPRFPASSVESDVVALRRAGADISFEPIDGDHFILLTNQQHVTEAMATWLNESLASVH